MAAKPLSHALSARDVANDNLDLCFIAIHPKTREACRRMLAFFAEHYTPWSELSGRPSAARHPLEGLYHAPGGDIPTIEFHYSTDIDPHEQQYIASLARWTALRIGLARSRRVGKVSQTARSQGHRIENLNKYEVPCVFYNGHEKWLVIQDGVWQQKLSPDEMGVGTLCDEHGFRSQDALRKQQLLHHVQNLNGLVLPHVREMREVDQQAETVILGELRRLSALWAR